MKAEIMGGSFPVAIVELEQGQAVQCESGAMAWFNGGLKMYTNTGGGLFKMFGRWISGESIFLNRYVAEDGPGIISIAAHSPGEIRKVSLTPDKPILVQKGSFLAMDDGADLSMFFQKKLKSGLFGGEGFVMNKMKGTGDVLLEIDGGAVEYDLEEGETLIIDTGYLVMMDATCKLKAKMVKGLKNIIFGGEGLFNTHVTGPGHVIVQTMPLSRFTRMVRGIMKKIKKRGR